MQEAIKGKVLSTFVANPMIGIPNATLMVTSIKSRKETDPFIEIYLGSKLPLLQPHNLLNHCALLQNALNSSLDLTEGLCLQNKDLEDENERMKRRSKNANDDLIKVTKQLLTMQQQEEPASSKPKRAPRGAATKALACMEKDRDLWRTSFQKLLQQTKESEQGKNFDKCHAKVKEVQDQL